MMRKVIKRIKSLLFWEIWTKQAQFDVSLADLSKRVDAQIEIGQRQLTVKYHDLKNRTPSKILPLNQTGFRVFSQFDEDGILLYIFSIIGANTQTCVEIGSSDGIECNTANLIVYHGWKGLFIDGNERLIKVGRNFYATHLGAVLNEPVFAHSWITKDNINQTILDSGFSGEVDLLSVDIDGVDYYIMEAIEAISPRVIICEIHSGIPLDKPLTIPYSDDFYAMNKPYPDNQFRSLSLCAANKLMTKKGYRLIGAHKFGFNVIFMKNGCGDSEFPAIALEETQGPLFDKKAMANQWEEIKGFGWIEV